MSGDGTRLAAEEVTETFAYPELPLAQGCRRSGRETDTFSPGKTSGLLAA
jgi:hypothetical protein